ncbi:hypothetical protein [Aeromonas veronii]|uniref:hypothetical protein n=1 Tax=Aeromonas veronii TaxID=654 RepID=UPI000CCEBEAF|nr:hypothetical protein [Aeromonas veronii]PNW67787.1 hypothetical protein C2U29_08910 [Aeromonas veronii]
MEEFLNIFSSPLAVAIAWICTVFSCFYALLQKSNATKIRQNFNDLNIKYNDLNIKNLSLEQKITEIENNDIHDNYQEVNQSGNTNINQGVIKGQGGIIP